MDAEATKTKTRMATMMRRLVEEWWWWLESDEYDGRFSSAGGSGGESGEEEARRESIWGVTLLLLMLFTSYALSYRRSWTLYTYILCPPRRDCLPFHTCLHLYYMISQSTNVKARCRGFRDMFGRIHLYL